MAPCAPSSSTPCGVRDADGAEGVGYTFTVGRNGGRRATRCCRGSSRTSWPGEDADRDRGAVAQGLVGAPLRRPRRADRARALGLRHGALGPEGAPGRPAALEPARRPRPARAVPMPAASTSTCPSTRCSRQTDGNLAKGFRAIKMKVGRRASRRTWSGCAAMRAHLGDGFPLMADANMKWSADEAIRAARALRAARSHLARGADHPGRSRGPRAHRARGRPARGGGREPAQRLGVQALHRGRRRDLIRSRT